MHCIWISARGRSSYSHKSTDNEQKRQFLFHNSFNKIYTIFLLIFWQGNLNILRKKIDTTKFLFLIELSLNMCKELIKSQLKINLLQAKMFIISTRNNTKLLCWLQFGNFKRAQRTANIRNDRVTGAMHLMFSSKITCFFEEISKKIFKLHSRCWWKFWKTLTSIQQ